ncbi:MAG: DUF58 domain-containing protein [Desulfuromonas sp.]|nr:MAG: DUF58 domain-containing protein [Desulfuromonas sp.]
MFKHPSSNVQLDLAELIALRGDATGFSLAPRRLLSTQGGDYRTRFRGRGMEFAEVRGYQAGDDVRTIDWRVTARRGKPHTKLFQEERERPLLLAIDYRRPMFFGTRGCFKAVQVSRLAALFGWRAQQQGDRVGAFLFSEEQHREIRPQRGKGAVLTLLRALVNDPSWQRPLHQPFEPKQRLVQTIVRLRRVARPGSLVILLSDFTQWDSEVEKQLSLLQRHNDLGLVFCYDRLERDLPPDGTYRVSDGSSDLTIMTQDDTARDLYRQRFADHLGRLRQFSRQQGCLLVPCATDDAPGKVLRDSFPAARGA